MDNLNNLYPMKICLFKRNSANSSKFVLFCLTQIFEINIWRNRCHEWFRKFPTVNRNILQVKYLTLSGGYFTHSGIIFISGFRDKLCL